MSYQIYNEFMALSVHTEVQITRIIQITVTIKILTTIIAAH